MWNLILENEEQQQLYSILNVMVSNANCALSKTGIPLMMEAVAAAMVAQLKSAHLQIFVLPLMGTLSHYLGIRYLEPHAIMCISPHHQIALGPVWDILKALHVQLQQKLLARITLWLPLLIPMATKAHTQILRLAT